MPSTRARLRRAVIVVVAVLLGTVGVLVGRSLWLQYQRDLRRKGLEFLPGVSQHIQDFRRVKVKEGRKVWEVSARDARYFEEQNTVVVRAAVMEWHLKDGRRLGLRGEEARILLAGRDVARVELSGNIEVTLADYLVKAERVTYDHTSERISAPGRIEISGRALDLSGDGMEIDVQTQRLTLLQNVSTRLQPALLRGRGDAAGS